MRDLERTMRDLEDYERIIGQGKVSLLGMLFQNAHTFHQILEMTPTAKKTKHNNKGIVLIKKANNLIESRYKFDVWETRVFLSLLAQIRKEDEDFEEVYRIWYKDVIKTFGLKSGDSYEALREATKGLADQSFFINYNENGALREKKFRIIKEVDYLKEGQAGEGFQSQEYVDITIDPKMKQLLLQLKANFTSYDLRNVVKLGVYPVRVYELLKQYERIGKRKLEIDEMKRMFEVTEQYKLFGDFYRWIIEPAVTQINKYTDLNILEVEKLKEGRKVMGLIFSFELKDEEALGKARAEKTTKKVVVVTQEQLIPCENIEGTQVRGNSRPQTSETNTLHQTVVELYPLVQEWMEKGVFEKLLKSYPAAQVKRAIDYTLKRLHKGDTITNVAGHIIEMTKQEDFVDAEAIKAEQEAMKRARAKAIEAAEATLDAEKKALHQEQHEKEGAIIASILAEFPAQKESLVEMAKSGYGNTYYDEQKTVNENLSHKLFAVMFRLAVRKQYPERFVALEEAYKLKIAEIERKKRQL